MTVPNRNYQSLEYRYGFQGQEKDDEVKGSGNSLNYMFRMHDPRVGRFFATDPLTAKYPHYTPYSFSGNKVIAYSELEGLEEDLAIIMIIALEEEEILKNGTAEEVEALYKAKRQAATIYFTALTIYGTGAVYGTGRLVQGFWKAAVWTSNPVNQEVAVGIAGLTASVVDPDPSNDYPGKLDDLFRPFKSLFKSKVADDLIEFAIKDGGKVVEGIGESKIVNGILEMDFNVGQKFLGNGIGKEMLEETFRSFKDKIKGVDVNWGMSDLYPGNLSKGLKEAWEFYDSTPGATPLQAIKESGLYKLLKEKGFTEIKIHYFERDGIEATFKKAKGSN